MKGEVTMKGKVHDIRQSLSKQAAAAVLTIMLSGGFLLAEKKLPLDSISLPPGFTIHIFADSVKNARSLCRSPAGTLFVGTRRAGNVYAVVDRDGDFRADIVHHIASGLNMPNGVAFRRGSLYVAEVDRILRFDRIEERLESPPEPAILPVSLPRDKHHGWKFIRFGPDGRLYVPVGAPCNVCKPDNPIYATILNMTDTGHQVRIFAKGVRNTVGFDWHPESGELWFTDNGRDWLGDDLPPDELNHAPRQGLHFGFPHCHGMGIQDPEFGDGKPCGSFTQPAMALGPHVAALGMRFYTGGQFPPEYRNQIFIAEHGSWNRSVPIGYRITNVFLKGSRAVAYRPFAEGWIRGRWGRPVDLLVMPDGSILVSDDRAGVIYRIYFNDKGAKATASE
jgi:glucose/arabinose dehydrogenase